MTKVEVVKGVIEEESVYLESLLYFEIKDVRRPTGLLWKR